MIEQCESCEHLFTDYTWDDEGEETPIYSCENGCDCGSDVDCSQYKKYIEKPYIEKDTKCDTCPNLSNSPSVINITTLLDTRTHLMGRCEPCIRS